jgi:hypothetical protein
MPDAGALIVFSAIGMASEACIGFVTITANIAVFMISITARVAGHTCEGAEVTGIGVTCAAGITGMFTGSDWEAMIKTRLVP